MWPDLRRRSAALELMDDLAIGGAELREALRQLRVINYALGAARPTLEGVASFWRAAGKPAKLTVLDVGAGSGDLSRALLRWADRHGVQIQLVLADIHPETCAAAAAAHQGEPRVAVVCSDLLQLALRPVDIVTAALFTHHFSQAQLPAVYHAMVGAARYGVVVNDLHRHPLAWAFIWLATRLLSRNRMIRHDAPLSVWRGFRAADLQRLRAEPGLGGLQFMWRPLFRYLIMLPGGCHAG
jgi:2-polyprenyl-3-methyl-5-hydroxy-6-metoxy-1,4-benzoquinol methylase